MRNGIETFGSHSEVCSERNRKISMVPKWVQNGIYFLDLILKYVQNGIEKFYSALKQVRNGNETFGFHSEVGSERNRKISMVPK